MKYNAPDSTFHRVAKRIQANSRELLNELDQLATSIPSVNGDHSADQEAGDLEPARHLLELLLSQSGDSQQRDMLANIFAFELEPPKEPTPPPPPSPVVPVKKRDTYADRKKRWEEKEAARIERLATGRATRAGQAKEEAFEHEAGILSSTENEGEAGPGPSTRRTRQSMGNSSSEMSNAPDRTSSSTGARPSRPQVGVAGREIVERLSDKERRAREQELGLETPAVDNSDQFTRFNTGWILPEGSRRRRQVDTTAMPPPKPRIRKRESRLYASADD
jgi:NuA3 HAT complex component NTO1